MSMPMSPCHYCPDRYVGCKSDCERWADYSARFAEYKAIINTAKKRELDLTYHIIECNVRGKKLKGAYR